MDGALLRSWQPSANEYVEITLPQGIDQVRQFVWLETVRIGLALWKGQFEDAVIRTWLRWCDRKGQVIPTGAEGQEIERQRADRLAERESFGAEIPRDRLCLKSPNP
jgi:hypothetical protein